MYINLLWMVPIFYPFYITPYYILFDSNLEVDLGTSPIYYTYLCVGI